MLSHHLKGALVDLQDLIKITQSDIDNIREANNNPQFKRLSLKEEKLKSFESKKAMIDYEISSLISSNPNINLPDLLNEEQFSSLDSLKEELKKLHEINKTYAKLVLTVSTLYNKFLEQLVPTEMQGYKKVASKNPSILEVRV